MIHLRLITWPPVVFSICIALVIGIALPARAQSGVCPGFHQAIQFDEPGSFAALTTYGEYLVTLDNLGLSVWGLEDPDHPTVVGSAPTPRGTQYGYYAYPQVVVNHRGYAFVMPSIEDSRLQCFDLRDPLEPKLVWASSDIPEIRNNADIAVCEDVLAVLAGSFPLAVHFIDVSDPSNPVPVTAQWQGSAPSFPVAIAGSGSFLAVQEHDVFGGLLLLYDIGNGQQPVRLAEMQSLGGTSIKERPWAGSTRILVQGSSGTRPPIAVIDVSDPDHVEIVRVENELEVSYITGATWRGDIAYLVGWLDGSYKTVPVDFSDITHPVQLDPYPEGATFVAAGRDRLYRLTWSRGFEAHQLSSGLQLVGAVDPPGYAESMAVLGEYGYLADGNAGLMIVDLGEPLDPHPIATVALSGYAEAIAVGDGEAYVAANTEGLHVVDVRNPRHPEHVVQLPLSGQCYDVTTSGGVAMVATRAAENNDPFHALIIDVSEPGRPRQVGALEFGREGAWATDECGIDMDGHIAWLAAAHTLYGIDVADSSHADIVGQIQLLDDGNYYGLNDVALMGDFALVTTLRNGLFVVDISDPSAPTLHSTLRTGYAWELDAAGTTAVVKGTEMHVIDFTDMDMPIIRAVTPTRSGWQPTLAHGVLYDTAPPFVDVWTLNCRPPEADFQWQVNDLFVAFEDRSKYFSSTWTWDFGDGSRVSHALNPTHSYAGSGVYPVTLKVDSEQGSDERTQYVYVGGFSPVRRTAGRKSP